MTELSSKINEQLKRKEERLKIMKQMKEEKELEGCTFAPERVTKKKNKNDEKRDLQKFLDD